MKACVEHSRDYQQRQEAEAAMKSSVLGSDAYCKAVSLLEFGKLCLSPCTLKELGA
jgi:hypothetical protein